MNRRDFIKQCLSYTATTGATLLFGGLNKVFPQKLETPIDTKPDLVAIKGSEPDHMFDQGIKALGGIGRFVKKGEIVVIKPNIGWDVTPELGANTNPKLVARIVQHCYEAGAKKVLVLDHTCDFWKYTYKNSGIEENVKLANGEMVPGHLESYY